MLKDEKWPRLYWFLFTGRNVSMQQMPVALKEEGQRERAVIVASSVKAEPTNQLELMSVLVLANLWVSPFFMRFRLPRGTR